eukprot:2601863-Heterocapsa_arctica.AAC.1
MEGQMENFPDRGIEKPMKSLANPRAILDREHEPTCYKCGKTRNEHVKKTFCKDVKKVIQKKGDRKGEKGDVKGAKGLGKGKPVKKPLPDFMVGAAFRTPATR